MINSNAFNYINVLDKAADASWIRNDVIANNIANATTPGYKRQDVDFESEFRKALKRSRLGVLNVDIETENVTLASNQLKYNGLIDCINKEFSNLQMVMK